MSFTKIFKPWHLFLAVVGGIFIANHPWGSTYVGIDNLSPFWGIEPILAQIQHSGNFFTFGPLLYSWWFYLLSFLGISASLTSVLYVYGYLLLALIGYYNLLIDLSKKVPNPLLYLAVFFGSLVPLWVFSTHEMMFMSLFTAFPFILRWALKRARQHSDFVTYLFFLPMFFTSSINLAVFTFGIAILVLLVIAFGEFKPIFALKIFVIAVTYLVLTQAGILSMFGNRTVSSEAYSHLTVLNQSSEMRQITTDLQKSEVQNASVTNALRFATGWLALFDDQQNYLLPWAKTYRSNYFIVGLQLIAVASFILAPFLIKQLGGVRSSSVVYLAGGIILSVLGLTIINSVPILGVLLRSASTKLWLLLWLPFLVLGVTIFSEPLVSKIQKAVLLLCLLIPAFPWYTGNFAGKFNTAIIPPEYETFYQKLDYSDTVLVLPKPTTTYFRKYSWGYYGSSLVVFMSKAEIYDGATIGKEIGEYQKLVSAKNLCESRINRYIIEHGDLISTPSCLKTDGFAETVYDNFSAYSRKQ